jgi:putative ABC transport system permease protein
MNLLNKLTITNLKLNKKRTIVTIIGIILATALITAVAGMVTSFRQTLINWTIKTDGNYHYSFKNVPSEELKYIENNRSIENYYLTQDIGYAKLNESKNEYKPYLYVMSYNKEALKNAPIELVEGRLPQNENELVISEHIITNGKVNYKIGQKISLEMGERLSENSKLDQQNPYNKDEEEFNSKFNKTYEIVGIMQRQRNNVEPYSAPGYTVITYLDDSNIKENTNIYVLLNKNKLKDRYKVFADILNITEDLAEKNVKGTITIEEFDKLNETAKYKFEINKDLLRIQALEFGDSILSTLYALSIIIISIIIVTSVFCIRNSFAISITEKMKQYGMLASVGATSKQIKKNVFYEALILSVIAIPIGVLCGMLAVFIVLKVISAILAESLNGMIFVYSIPWAAIGISVILAMITIFLSARKSAKRAAKVSPIEAIRSNEDIKIKSKKLRSPKIIKKIFGVGGDIAYKNLKRNKKKYRTTVISIVVSVAIFIPTSTFINYAFKTSSMYYQYREARYNLVVRVQKQNQADNESINKIIELDGIKEYSIQKSVIASVDIKDVKYSSMGREYIRKFEEEGGSTTTNFSIYSVGKEEYNRYISKLGLKYDDVKDKAILINSAMTYVRNDKGRYINTKFEPYEYKVRDIIKVKLVGNGIEDKNTQIEIAKTTDKVPMGFEGRTSNGYIIVSNEWIEQNSNYLLNGIELYINCNNSDVLEENIRKIDKNLNITNIDSYIREQKAMWIVIAIFLYGFITVISLIGVTNIFNTITTNMNLRSKEFANLKSIGMTTKEFNRMIRLESIFYGTKSLLIGIPIGTLLSYLMFKAFGESVDFGFIFPVSGIFISIIAVFSLIIGIMKYSLNKINKQNIIETIRKDNI